MDKVELNKLVFEDPTILGLSKAIWWSSTQFDSEKAWVRFIDFDKSSGISRGTKTKSDANYVRCIKD
jgi:hypothetical protein